MSGVIYIMTHKEFQAPDLSGYVPLYVGAVKEKNHPYPGDDAGENISGKNANFCELTGLYWIWKNDKSEYVGLCHYRRYFTSNRMSRKIEKFMGTDEAVDILKTYDIIVPKPTYFVGKNVKDYYAVGHYAKDLEAVRTVITDICPDYLKDFDWYMEQKCGYSFNMFFAPKLLADEYCKWLFAILFELERKIDISNYDKLQARIFGFLSERLFNVWLKHNRLKVYEKPVVNMQESRWVFVRRIPLELLLNIFEPKCRRFADNIERDGDKV